MQLVRATLAEIECFIAMDEKQPDDINEKAAALKDTRLKAKPMKAKVLKLLKHLKGLGKLPEEEAGGK